MEGLLENVRQLSRELKLQMLIIDNFIPPEYQVIIPNSISSQQTTLYLQNIR